MYGKYNSNTGVALRGAGLSVLVGYDKDESE
jgi:hypothetical protein